MKHQTKAERTSERELVTTRIINGPAQLVFEAWARPELFKKWWVPKSAPMTLLSCEMDVRTGGNYRLRFGFNDGTQTMDFFGRYLEVTPYSRIVWSNEEGGEDAMVVTTVSFAETKGTTLVTVHDLYPSKEALDEAIASGATGGLPEQFEQLEQLIAQVSGTTP